MKEMTVQKMSVKKIHSRLKSDLQQCIEYLEQGKPEYVNLDAAMIEEDGTRQIIVGVKFYR